MRNHNKQNLGDYYRGNSRPTPATQISLLFTAAMLALALSACDKSPEDQYLNELTTKTDTLVKAMRDADGMFENQCKMASGTSSGIRMHIVKYDEPKMMLVAEAASNLRIYFTGTTMSLVPQLREEGLER